MDPKEFEARRHEFTYQELSQTIGACSTPGQQAAYRALLDLTEASLEAAYEALRSPSNDMWGKVKMGAELGELVGNLVCLISVKTNAGIALRARSQQRLAHPAYLPMVQLARLAPEFKGPASE